jgi:hypothetical protein
MGQPHQKLSVLLVRVVGLAGVHRVSPAAIICQVVLVPVFHIINIYTCTYVYIHTPTPTPTPTHTHTHTHTHMYIYICILH